MIHDDHVRLLRGGISEPGGVWADLGSGWGAFTLALADLLGPSSTIYSVDQDRGALREQERSMRARFPGRAVSLPPRNVLHPQPARRSVITSPSDFSAPRQTGHVRGRFESHPAGLDGEYVRLVLVAMNVDVPSNLENPRFAKPDCLS